MSLPYHLRTFSLPFQLVGAYPVVAKSLRDMHAGKPMQQSHCCGAQMHEHGLGYKDLDPLVKDPQELEFIIGKGFDGVCKLLA